MSHSADYAFAPCFAVLASFHRTLVTDDIIDGLTKFSGEHTFEASTYYPPIDKVPRNITTWMSEKLTIGAESFDETAVGGPALNQEAFNPAVIQWDTGSEISFISVGPRTIQKCATKQQQLTIHLLALPNRNGTGRRRLAQQARTDLPLRQLELNFHSRSRHFQAEPHDRRLERRGRLGC